MKKLIILSLLTTALGAKAQKIDSIFFNLYTDSLKKGVYNYINIDAKLSNGNYLPLSSDEIHFTSTFGKWDGNNLIIEKNASVDSISIIAYVKDQPNLKRSITVYLKKIEIEPELKTEKELLEEWQRRSKRKSKKNLA